MHLKIHTTLLASAFFLVAGSAHAEYRIQPGDVLEIAVTGLPDIKQRGTVDNDGQITVPLTPPVLVAGLGLGQVQARIKELLSQRIYQHRGADGRDSVTAISPDSVIVTIAEYRPVYLTGDVTKPGEQAFRPGLTVRQAVALAGGYEIMRFRMNNPFLEGADLRSAYQTAWMGYVDRQARIWRIQKLLDPNKAETPELTLEKLTEAPLPATFLNTLRTNAREQLASASSRFKAEQSYLTTAVTTADAQVTLLKGRQGKDEENVQVDAADYEKLKDFNIRGNLPSTRLAEARRLYLFSAIQSLQTGVQLVNTTRERDEAGRKVMRLAESNRADLLKELDATLLERDGLLAQLQAVGEKITYTGVIRSQLSRGGGATPKILIIHPEADGGGSVSADENSTIQPGDTIEVALHTEIPGTPAR